jgi:hypothetical protein
LCLYFTPSLVYTAHNYNSFNLNFKLSNLDKNVKICYVCEANPAWFQVLKQKDLSNWTRPLEDKTMNISKFMDDTIQKVDQINWKKVAKDVIKAWDLFFKIFVIVTILTYLAGKSLGNWVHRLNDWLATKWVQVLGLAGPTKLGRVSPTNVEIVEETIVVEVELMLPPTPMVVVDPWYDMSEVEPILPLESLSTFFNTPLMIAAVREPVALLAPELQEQQTPARRRRRQSTQKSPQEVVKPESPLSQLRRPRGRRAHQDKQRARRAGQAA